MANHFIGYQSGRRVFVSIIWCQQINLLYLVSVACMTTYDTRLIAVVGLSSLILFKMADIRWKQISFVIKFIGFFALFKCF